MQNIGGEDDQGGGKNEWISSVYCPSHIMWLLGHVAALQHNAKISMNVGIVHLSSLIGLAGSRKGKK